MVVLAIFAATTTGGAPTGHGHARIREQHPQPAPTQTQTGLCRTAEQIPVMTGNRITATEATSFTQEPAITGDVQGVHASQHPTPIRNL